MLEKEHRQKKVVFKTEKIFQTLNERKHLFASESTKGRIKECLDAIKDPQKGVFLEDKREGVQSSHNCIFLSEKGH